MTLANQFEQTIRQHRLPGLSLPTGERSFVFPHYGGYSIANVAPTIAALLRRGLPDSCEPLPSVAWADLLGNVRTVVQVLLDGVGYWQFLEVLQLEDDAIGRLARMGRALPLTSVFPSTTMTALTSLWSGRTPGEHGFLGTRLYLSEFGVVANMLRLAPVRSGDFGTLPRWGWQPEKHVPVPLLAEQLSGTGIHVTTHLPRMYLDSALTKVFHRGVEHTVGYVGHSDMWINVRDSLTESEGAEHLVNVYWTGTDDVGHAYGPHGERSQSALRDVVRSMQVDFLDRLPPAARKGTVLLITSDHGQTSTPLDRAVSLSDHPDLEQMLLLPPAAEMRASYLSVRPGLKRDVAAYINKHLADRFALVETEKALAAGLWGPTEWPPLMASRVGEYVLLARDESQLLDVGERTGPLGHHGSLTEDEMLVPLLMMRLEA